MTTSKVERKHRTVPHERTQQRRPTTRVLRSSDRGELMHVRKGSSWRGLRLSTQVPRRAHVAAPVRAPEATAEVRFVSRPTRTARAKARLTPTDVALLETLGAWESVVEVPTSEGWARLAALLGASGRRRLVDQVPDVDPRTRVSALALLSP